MRTNHLKRSIKNNMSIFEDIASNLQIQIELCVQVSKTANATYDITHFTTCMNSAAIHDASVSGKADNTRLMGDDHCRSLGTRHYPTSEWNRLVLAKMDKNKVETCFEDAVVSQINMLKAKGQIPKKGINIAIDMHKILRHDKKPSAKLIHTKDKGHIGYYERYITAQSVSPGIRLNLSAYHMPALESIEDFVRKILVSCQNLDVKINYILLDREFFNARIMSLIDKMGMYYIIPCKNTDTVVQYLREFDTKGGPSELKVEIKGLDGIITTYYMNITERKKRSKKIKDRELRPEEKYIGFATNLPGTDIEIYDSGWRIETGYRMVEDIRSKTRSRNSAARTFCFMYSLLFYNAWVMINILFALLYGLLHLTNPVITQGMLKTALKRKINETIILPEPPPDVIWP